MTELQKTVKYLAVGLAALLSVSIIGGIVSAIGIVGGYLFEGEEAASDMKSYSVSAEIQSLRVDIGAVIIEFEENK